MKTVSIVVLSLAFTAGPLGSVAVAHVGGAIQGQDNAAKQRKEYDDYKKIESEQDPAKKLELARAFFESEPTPTYVKYVQGQVNAARYALFTRYKEAGDLANAVKIADEYVASVPETDLFFAFQLTTLAEGKALKQGVSPTAAPAWDEAAKYAAKALRLVVEENKSEAMLYDAKTTTWDKVKPGFIAYFHRLQALAHFTAKRNNEAEKSLLASIEAKCDAYPDVYFLLGQIHNARYDEKAGVFNKLSAEAQGEEKGQKLLQEAKDEAKKASEFFARGILIAEASPNKDAYKAVVANARKELEEAYEIWNDGKQDGLAEYLASFKSSCQP
ncbi:MAG: hypothetical protein SNJ67_09015 [Chloracidobacterium sp.]|uniref:Tetratricopeptide repeat protein n=1 Tax=Chloracidobacterium validum TaxID=2821543 RepID=A0ABX8BBN2_9BACT|nr:hypothetical protein [Chloracidobacterium validum]QUW04099.1 hypothetical protein J8C06_13690 [Chloracidobacterium validum]